MRNGTIGSVVAFIVGIGVAFGGQFTDTDKAKNHGKTGLDNLTAEIDANFAIIEGVFPSSTVISNKYLKIHQSNGDLTSSNATFAGSVTITAGALANDTVREADLMAVDSASDEDFLSYESTTGDFEWHSAAEIAGKFTEGVLADSIVVSADIKDGVILDADIRTNTIGKAKLAAADFGDFTVGADGTCELDANSVGATELADDAVTKASMNAEDFGDFTAGADGTCELDSGVVGSTEIANASIVDADVSATAAIAHSKLATDGILDVVAAAASSTEAASALVITTVTFTNVSMVATDTSDEGESVKIADFDAGAFTVLGAILNATCTISAGATGAHYIALGTVAAADDSDLTSTEADLIPKTTLSASGAKAADAVLAATIVFDGTATAKDLYFNWAIDDDNMNANTTNVVTGTLTIISTKAVDNQ